MKTAQCTIWQMTVLILNIYYFYLDKEMVSLQTRGLNIYIYIYIYIGIVGGTEIYRVHSLVTY